MNVAPGSNGAAQTVQAFNLGDGTLNLKATTSASWLAATVGSAVGCSQPGGSCYPIKISLNTSGLAAGVFTEYVTVTDPNAVDSPQDIAVTVNTTGVPGTINAYVAPFGSANSNAMFPIYTTGTGVQAAVTTQSGGNWLQFLNGAGLVTYPAPYLIEVASRPGQAPGVYAGSVVLTGSSVASDNKTINVNLNVTSSPIIDTTAITPVRVTSYPGGPAASSSVVLNNLGQGTLTVTGGSSSSKFLSVTGSGNTLTIAADPTGLTPGVYSGTVSVASNAANTGQFTIPVELLVGTAGQPAISAGGIVNIANGAQEAVSQGDIVAIYGNQLAAAGTSALNPGPPPLATTLGGTQVLVNGVPAPLFYVSPGQINFQIPYSLAAGQSATVQVVSNGVPGNLRPVAIAATVPRLLYFVSFIQGTYGIIVNALDGSLTLPTGTSVPGFNCHPAKPGDTLIVFGIGYGQTSPAAVAGAAASSTTLQSIANVTATFGGGFQGTGQTVDAGFAGLTPTFAGLYQTNVTIPTGAPLGSAVPLITTVNGLASNTVTLAISADGK
ncbi:MAG: hypothetical protein M3N54_10485 [Acidobacteriota bacterium]|nr:hypothetical protein [Acidobacteriota bacterium]